MKIFSILMICLLFVVLLTLVFLLVIGRLCFRLSLSRKSAVKRIAKKITKNNNEKYLIDHAWWENKDLQTLTITSFDGLNLVGHLIECKNSNKFAVLVHGYGGNYKDLNNFAQMFLDKGYSILAVECRAHGNSEGDMIGMGWLDRLDLKAWIELLVEQNPSCKILLFGQSMGASTVCMTLGEKLPNNVVCAISDCAFDNVYRQIYSVCHRYFGFLTKPVLNIFNSYMKRTRGYNLKTADACKQLKKSTIPVLFIHGNKDDFVHVEMCYRLSEILPETRRQVMIVDDAGHIESYAKDKQSYTKTVNNFCKRYNM